MLAILRSVFWVDSKSTRIKIRNSVLAILMSECFGLFGN